MKKLTFFFAWIISMQICFAQQSNLHIEITDTAMKMFMDTVEEKLLAHLDKIQSKGKRKISCDVNLYGFIPDEVNKQARWCVPLTLSEIMDMTLPKERLSTYRYELSMAWNYNLDTAMIIGFSRMYYQYYQSREDLPLHPHLVSYGPYCYPIYNIPISQYRTFLNDRQMKKLYAVIRQSFVQYVSDYDYPAKFYKYKMYVSSTPYSCFPCNDTLSQRTIDLEKGDSISPQFSLLYWTDILRNRIIYGPLLWVYSQADCLHPLTKWDITNIFEKTDSLKDKNNNPLAIAQTCDMEALTIVEKWTFDESKVSQVGQLVCMLVSKKIQAIGINTGYYDYACDAEKRNGTAWLKYDDIAKPELNPGKLALYKDILDYNLYKKLQITFPKF